jgi:chitodextrinase
VARFAATAAGLTVSVDGRGSTDADGRVVAYAWDFGDGTRATGAQPPAHTYARGGDYRITLTVTDDKGATGTNTKTTTVVDPNPPTAPPTTPPTAPPTTSPPAKPPTTTPTATPAPVGPPVAGPLPAPVPSSPLVPPALPTTPPSFGGGPTARPAKVTGLTVVKRSKRSIRVTYNAPIGAQTYAFRAKAGRGAWVDKGSTSRTRFTVKRLRSKTTYRIQVRALGATGTASAPRTVRARTR